MFDSPFLSDGSQPLRGAVLSYFILSLILFSVFYFVAAFLFEIKASKAKRKTKRQVLWSKVKGLKHRIVEDAKKQQQESKLQALLSKKVSPRKAVSAFNLTATRSIVPKASVQISSLTLEKKLHNSSSERSSSSSDQSIDSSSISVNSGNDSSVDLLSRDSADDHSSASKSSRAILGGSSSSSVSSSSAAVSSSSGSDSEVSYASNSTPEQENEFSSGDEETLMTGSSDNRSVSSVSMGLNSDIDVESGISSENAE